MKQVRQLKDPTRNAIRNVIEPWLSNSGFVPAEKMSFNRLRGPLIDHISFEFGRWGRGEVIYAYFSVHLVEDPVTSLHTHHAGGRLGASWYPEDRDACKAAAEAMLDNLRLSAFLWFDEIDSISKYEGAWFDSGIAVAFAAIARSDVELARIYLRDALARKAPVVYSSGYPGWRSNEHGRSQDEVDALTDALAAIESGTVDVWRRKIREQRLDELGMKR